MSDQRRPTSESWQSRPAAASPHVQPSLPSSVAEPVVIHRVDPDTGPLYYVRLGAFTGPERGNRHLAEIDADALRAALAPALGVASRVAALLASPEARDAVAGRCAAPASAALAVLRWCSLGPDAAPTAPVQEEPRGWGEAPTLDRVLAGAGVAIVCGEEDDL